MMSKQRPQEIVSRVPLHACKFHYHHIYRIVQRYTIIGNHRLISHLKLWHIPMMHHFFLRMPNDRLITF